MKLNGSKKQMAWAQDILNNAEQTIKGSLEKAKENFANTPDNDGYKFAVEVYQSALAGFEKLVASLDEKPDNAKTVIDNREKLSTSYLRQTAASLLTRMVNAAKQ